MKIVKNIFFVFMATLLVGCGGGSGGGTKSVDSISEVNIQTSTLNINNNAPKVSNQTITLNENQTKEVVLSATDAEGDSLTYRIITAPKHGKFLNGIYIPDSNFVGSDSFTYVANDGTVDSVPSTVTIIITAVAEPNQTPVAIGQSVTVDEDTIDNLITLAGTDADGDSLTYAIVTQLSHGTVTLSGNVAKYTPTADYAGADSFSFKVNDGKVDSAPVTVTIVVRDVAESDTEAPIITLLGANPQTLTVGETYTELGATVTDNVDTNLTVNIDSTTVDMATSGTYIVTYNVSDTAGNVATEIKRRVVVANPKDVTLSGKITYERVHTHSNNIGLDYDNITQEAVRNILVDIVDANGNVLKTTTTDDSGNYSVVLPLNQEVKVRAYAKMLKMGTPAWDVKVVDNSNGYAQYVIEGSLATTGERNSVRNLKALASTKTSPPFAIIDSTYDAMKKVLEANANTVFPKLNLNWTVNNKESGTYFDGDKNIMILGDQHGDSDEYDDHVIVHEWGHYFESKFSRADSIGGGHAMGDSLDIRVAFGEGWGNAWSAIATDDPIYFDTVQNSGWNMNIESANHSNSGWFSEASVQRILYDLYDSNDDGSDHLSLGFTPIYNVLVGKEKVTPAFTSIFTFIKALKDENAAEIENIDSIVFSEKIASITDIWGTGRSNKRSAYPYYNLSVGAALTNIITSNRDGKFNKLSNHKYVKFTIDTAGEYTIKVKQTDGSNSDPDFHLYQSSPFKKLLMSEAYIGGVEEKKVKLNEGDYLLDITDAKYLSTAQFTVTINQ